jgi:cytoskeletal protein RodZ
MVLILASFVMIIVDIVSLAKKKPLSKGAILFKYIATVGVMVTFIVVYAILCPAAGWNYLSFALDPSYLLWVHTVNPLLAFISFVFFEDEPHLNFRATFLGAIEVVLYAAAMIPLVWFYVVYPPYLPMFALHDVYDNLADSISKTGSILYPANSIGMDCVWICGMILGAYLVAVLTWLLRNLFVRKFQKEQERKEKDEAEDRAEKIRTAQIVLNEDDPSEKKASSAPVVEQEPEAAKPADKADGKASGDDVAVIEDTEDSEEQEEAEEVAAENQAKEANPTNYQNGPRVYHIAKQTSTGKWQVRLATGQKAIKLFDTQAQAIDYAKSLVRTQGGSIRVHSLKGKLRKQ